MDRVPYYAPIVDTAFCPPSGIEGGEIVGEEKSPEQIHDEWVERNVRWRVSSIDDANLVSSHVQGLDGFHAPVLDLDKSENPVGVCMFIGNWLRKRGFPNTENDFVLVPSTSPGHFHLYVDVAIPWETYQLLLLRLGEEGILESGFVGVSLAREATFVRKPGHLKPQPEEADVSV